jgi:hypothetical protein
MAYALNYPNAPTDNAADVVAKPVAPQGFLARLFAGIERAQTARFRRELQLYSPHLYESLFIKNEYAQKNVSDENRAA